MKTVLCFMLLVSVAATAVAAIPARPQRTLPDGRRILSRELKITLQEAHARTLSGGEARHPVATRALMALHPDILAIEGRHTSARRWLLGEELPLHLRTRDGSVPRIARNFTAILRAEADVVVVRDALLKHPDVEKVDFRELVPMDSVPNDAFYAQQWAPPVTGLQSAWDVPGRGPVRVAVIDSGLELAHPEFAGRVVFHDGYADFDDGEAPTGGSKFDHGTHVAGIIAATRNNGIGVAGYSNDIQLMIMNCAAWDTDKLEWVISGSDDAMDDAVAEGASVINCSFGFSDSIEDEVVDAYNAGVLVVHAAGNNSSSIDNHWESTSIALLTVTATRQGMPPVVEVFDSSYSNFGTGVDLAAPGTRIYSTIGPGTYSHKDGTSMAAPQVSGAAALLMTMNPAGLLGHRAVRAMLIRMAGDLGTAGYDTLYGYGVLRLDREMAATCRAADAFVSSPNHPTSLPQETGAFDYPWRSITAALDHVSEGATIVLNAGVTDPPDFQLGTFIYPTPPAPLTKPCTLLALPDQPVVIGTP